MSLSRFVTTLALAVATSACVAACSSNKDAPGGDAGEDSADLVGCDDPRVQTYAANMQVPGAGKVFTFVLVSSNPSPPADETNTWTLQILDASGNPVNGVTGTATPTMPFMSHGTIPVDWTAAGNGTYTLTPLYLFMAGFWEVAITAEAGGKTDSASFYFCIPG